MALDAESCKVYKMYKILVFRKQAEEKRIFWTYFTTALNSWQANQASVCVCTTHRENNVSRERQRDVFVYFINRSISTVFYFSVWSHSLLIGGLVCELIPMLMLFWITLIARKEDYFTLSKIDDMILSLFPSQSLLSYILIILFWIWLQVGRRPTCAAFLLKNVCKLNLNEMDLDWVKRFSIGFDKKDQTWQYHWERQELKLSQTNTG